jgi:uncharacterized protein (DUF58 family)
MESNATTYMREAGEAFRASAGSGVEATLPELIALRPLARSLDRRGPVRASARLAGAHHSPVRGRGMEFCEVRAYVPGDEVRHIDWRVTARTTVPHSKLFEEERERPMIVVADMRSPMRFGTRQCFKSVAAARAAALLVWTANLRGDRVGGITLTDTGLHSQGMRRHQGGISTLLGAFASATSDPTITNLSNDGQTPSLADALLEVRRLASHGTEVFVLSDFSDLDSQARLHLHGLSRRTHPTCVMIHDPIESVPPAPGRYRVSNGREAVVIGLEDAASRAAWVGPFRSRIAALEEQCHDSRLRLEFISTADGGLSVTSAASFPIEVSREPTPGMRVPESARARNENENENERGASS